VKASAFALAVGAAFLFGASPATVAAQEPTLSEEDFEESKKLYFQRCAGCHGVLRKGATGKTLEPKSTRKLGQKRLERIIALGTEGGMNNFDDLFTKEQIAKLSTYIQMEVPPPAEMTLAEMKKRWKTVVKPADYPSKPAHNRNWENFFLVILRDAGMVGIIDGDTKEVVAKVDTGYAVHVMKESSDGRFWYTMGRDGRMTKIDLWMSPPQVVAETQIASDARDVAVSHFGQWKDKYVIGGGYWPPHFVVLDAVTMEPLKVVSTRGINVDGEYVNESRVAAVYKFTIRRTRRPGSSRSRNSANCGRSTTPTSTTCASSRSTATSSCTTASSTRHSVSSRSLPTRRTAWKSWTPSNVSSSLPLRPARSRTRDQAPTGSTRIAVRLPAPCTLVKA